MAVLKADIPVTSFVRVLSKLNTPSPLHGTGAYKRGGGVGRAVNYHLYITRARCVFLGIVVLQSRNQRNFG